MRGSKKRHVLYELTTCTKCGELYPWGPEYFHHTNSKECSHGCSQPCLICHNALKREWRETHREQIKIKAKEYQDAHKKEQAVQRREWAKANPIKRRLSLHKRRVKLRKAKDIVTPTDIDLQYKGQKGRCWWCKKPLKKYHIDHRVPLNKNGSHDKTNIVITCPTCNTSKGAKLPQQWAGRLL